LTFFKQLFEKHVLDPAKFIEQQHKQTKLHKAL